MNQRESKATVVSIPDVPSVVDFKDLGDPAKGHLISEAGRELLNRAMEKLPPGRYSKRTIKKKINQLRPKLKSTEIKKALPFIPGIIKGGYVMRVLPCRPPQTSFQPNELGLFIEDKKIHYIVTDANGNKRSGIIEEGNKDEQLDIVLYETLEKKIKKLDELYANYLRANKEYHDSINEPLDVDKLKQIYPNEGMLFHYSKEESVNNILMKRIFSIAGIDSEKGDIHAIYKGKDKALGEGAYGKVKIAFDINNKVWDVIKVIRQEHDEGHYEKEAANLKSLGKGRGWLIQRTKKKANPFKSDERQLNLVMDYAKGVELKKFLKTHPDLPARVLLDISIQITEKIAELHRKGYLHRDIKPENIMYDPVTREISIIDVGFAFKMENDKGEVHRGYGGTPGYTAPEIEDHRDDGDTITYSPKTEVYALGVSLKKILGFEPISSSYDLYTTFLFQDHHPELEKYLNQLLNDDDEQRPTFSDVSENLKNCRNDFLPLYPKTTGILNIANYETASKEEKETFIAVLKSMDLVVLVDDPGSTRDVIAYAQLRKELTAQGVFVAKDVIVSNNPADIVIETNNINTKIEEQHGNLAISSIYYFHTEKNNNNKATQGMEPIEIYAGKENVNTYMRGGNAIVSDRNLISAQEELGGDLLRFMNKHSVELKDEVLISKNNKKINDKVIHRVSQLRKNIDELERYKGGKITYFKLFNAFSRWENALLKQRSKASSLMFLKKSTSIENIRQIKYKYKKKALVKHAEAISDVLTNRKAPGK